MEGLIADLHIHSRYSRATSKNITLDNLVKYARIKGIGLLGTGDFTHPLWLAELKQKLKDNGEGIYYYQDFPFIFTSELSLIYSEGEKGRRIHLVLLAPSIGVVEQINSWLSKKGRLDYDGRPIFGMSCIELLENLLSIDKSIEVIPAHAWTPYFGIFGSMSGFDSLKEAFHEYAGKIHAIETGMSCYDGETEILTENGWKKFPNLKYSDKIYTFNIKTGKIELQNPIKIYKYKYKGKMYKLKTKRVDLLVTPNHKLLYSSCDFRKSPIFFLKEAEFLFNKSKRFKKNGLWEGKEIEYFTLPAVKMRHGSRYHKGFRIKKEKKISIKPWLKFFGFWLAEGWTTKGKNGDYGVYLCNKNKNLILEMKQILNSLDYGAYLYKNREIYNIRVRDYQLYNYLKQFGKSHKKFIPQEIKCLSKELLEIFLDYFIKGDGHIYGRTRKGLSITTNSINLRDDFQEIALKVGNSAYYKPGSKKGTPLNSLGKSFYKSSHDVWIIYFIRENLHTVLPSIIKKRKYIESWVDFDGNVYCVSVPNKAVYVRRNGIPVWCGNSDPAMNWRLSELNEKTIVSFSDAHSFWPFRIGREATIFNIEKDSIKYQNIIKQIRNNEILGTIETDPAYGKYHFDGHRLCNFSCSPQEALKLNNICPVCKKPLTIGVEHRVEELADKPVGFKPKNAKPFYKILPLHELIALAKASTLTSRKTWLVYNSIIEKFGNEFNVLLNVEKAELIKSLPNDALLVQQIIDNRIGNIKVKAGFDGQYGIPLVKETQKKLF